MRDIKRLTVIRRFRIFWIAEGKHSGPDDNRPIYYHSPLSFFLSDYLATLTYTNFRMKSKKKAESFEKSEARAIQTNGLETHNSGLC